MKIKRLIIAMLCLVLIVPIVGQSVLTIISDKTAPKKFEVTLTVTYNAITLKDAAEKELQFREKYKDACKVDITLSAVVSAGYISIGEAGYIYTGETNTISH